MFSVANLLLISVCTSVNVHCYKVHVTIPTIAKKHVINLLMVFDPVFTVPSELAPVVERWLRLPEVVGSIPAVGHAD